jgi:hypothetical protein
MAGTGWGRHFGECPRVNADACIYFPAAAVMLQMDARLTSCHCRPIPLAPRSPSSPSSFCCPLLAAPPPPAPRPAPLRMAHGRAALTQPRCTGRPKHNPSGIPPWARAATCPNATFRTSSQSEMYPKKEYSNSALLSSPLPPSHGLIPPRSPHNRRMISPRRWRPAAEARTAGQVAAAR